MAVIDREAAKDEVIQAARECECWLIHVVDSLGPPQEMAWPRLLKACEKLRSAIVNLDSMPTDDGQVSVSAEFVKAVRRHIRGYEPGTLIGSELNIALHLRDIDGAVWTPWTVPGTPDSGGKDGAR